jgi:hypothetical protein
MTTFLDKYFFHSIENQKNLKFGGLKNEKLKIGTVLIRQSGI